MTELTFKSREIARQRLEDKRAARIALAWDYGTSLDSRPKGLFHDVALLPADKLEIIHSLLYMIANAETRMEADLFAAALGTLAQYHDGVGDSIGLPPTDANDLVGFSTYPFKKVEQLTRQMWSDQERIDRAVGLALQANVLLVSWPVKVWHFLASKGRHHRAYAGKVDFMLDQ